MSQPRILIIDDDVHYAELASAYLRLSGLGHGTVEHADTMDAGLRRLRDLAPDLVFLDNRIPPQTDFRSGLRALREAGFGGPVIVQSACTADDVFDDARRLGAAEVIDKFLLSDELLMSLLRRHAPNCLN
jgi:CheY-like chemotaxis protein